MKFNRKLGIIGYGNMASCMVGAAIKQNVIEKKDILIYDINPNKAKADGLEATGNCGDIANCKYILLSVKPQSADDVFQHFNGNGNAVITIMAGISTATVQAGLGDVTVARCMPNTPCLIGRGAIGAYFGNLNADDKEFVFKLLAASGTVVEVEEGLLNAVTAVSGSGPAYFYYFIKAIIDSGVKFGLTYETSKQLSIHTAIGAAEMILNSDEDIELLIDRVCSKGGTTVQAIDCFRENNLEDIVSLALQKCHKRAFELEEKS